MVNIKRNILSISLKSLDYDFDKTEMEIILKDKEFNGQINKAFLEVKFKFGIQCYETDGNLTRTINQEVSHTILWTEHDIITLDEQINDIFYNIKKQNKYVSLGVIEPEFEGICFYSSDSDTIELFITIGPSTSGSAIRLYVKKIDLIEWVNKIKSYLIN